MKTVLRSLLVLGAVGMTACTGLTGSTVDDSSSSAMAESSAMTIPADSMLSKSHAEWVAYHNAQENQKSPCDAEPVSGDTGVEVVWVTPLHPIAKVLCTRGAYQSGYVFYDVKGTLGAGEQVEEIFFDMPFGAVGAQNWVGVPLAMEANFDATTGTLTTVTKDRGTGDCGSAGTYKWVSDADRGEYFELQEFRQKTECDGVAGDWPVTYTKAGPASSADASVTEDASSEAMSSTAEISSAAAH